MTMAQDPAPAESRFALLVASAFVAATIPRLLTHELWRDEAWLWLVALESDSLAELFRSLARSGQGYLFPLLCWVARHLAESPRAMQLVNLAAAGAAAWVLARWAPFPRSERVLLLVGYFTFYEYAVISRHYSLGMLLIWLACAFARERRSAIGLGIALGLACQTTVYAFIVAIAIACGQALERWSRRGEPAPLRRRDVAIGAALGLAGAIAGLVQLMPSEGTSFAPWWRTAWDPEHALHVLRVPWRAFLPLSPPEVPFWNRHLLDGLPRWQAAGGAALLAVVTAVVARSRAALATLGIGAAGLLLFAYAKFVGETRHAGHLWLLFVAALWLGAGPKAGREAPSWRPSVFRLLLIAQCGAAAFASWVDLRHPFSNATAAARLLSQPDLAGLPLLGHREPPVASVALALGRGLYSPSRGVLATHPDWGPRQREVGDPELRCIARAFSRREGSDVVLVMNRPLPAWDEVDGVGAVTGSICRSEDYHLYRMRLGRLAATEEAAGCGAGSR